MTDKSNGDTKTGKAHGSHGGAMETATRAYDKSRETASEALRSTKKGARKAAREATGAFEDNPLAILAGGIAIGAVIGTLIPRSAKEAELLGSVGKRLSEAATAAVAAARETGRQELETRGLTADAAKDRAKGLLDDVVKAAGTAGQAAAKAAVPTKG